jgi:hypothetical protein
MVAIAVLCGTRIRYTCLFIHLISDDLSDGVEEDGDSYGRRFHGVVHIVQSTCVASLVLKVSDGFKGSKATTLALGRWSLDTRA